MTLNIVDVDNMDDLSREPWPEQKEIQNIYEQRMLPIIESQKEESHINVSLTRSEWDRICVFFDMFAY